MINTKNTRNVILKWHVVVQLSALSLFPVCATAQVKQSSPIYTGSEIPGDPENGTKDLKNLFKYLKVFQIANGIYPSRSKPITVDIIRNPKTYGFETSKEAVESLVNMDDKFNDNPFVRSNPRSGLPAVFYKRPNGQDIGEIKKKGEVDAVAFSDTYVHYNGGDVSKNIHRPNPIGFYLVLYEDGAIERVPYDKQYYVYGSGGSPAGLTGLTYTAAFPHQAGVPYNTLSYEEYWDVIFGRKAFPFPPLGYRTLKGNPLPVPDNGEAEGVLNLLRQWQPNIERSQVWGALDKFGANNPSLSDLTSVTDKLGVSTQLQKLSLKELQQKGVPALMLLPDDGRIVAMLAVDSDFAVIIDRGRTFIIELAKLQERLGNQQFEALVPTKALTQNAAIVADNAVREVKLPSLDAEVPQQFTLRNTGATPITLQLEYPLLGVTESKLSKDVIAPGETATLDLKVKWRSILKAPYQNVLVSIQTNDPIVPRLQLAVLLTPPKAAQ